MTKPPTTTPPGPTAAALSKDDAVLEAVFLHEIKAAAVATDEAVCLTVRGTPGDRAALIAAIKARHPTAVPDAECGGGGPSGVVTLTATGGKAVRFDIGPISWLDANTAMLEGGGGHRGGGGIREVRYTVVKSAGGWKVTDEKVMRQT